MNNRKGARHRVILSAILALPTQTSNEFAHIQELEERKWTDAQHERVREAAIAVVRSHWPYDLPDGRVLSVVSGPALWALIAAIDRAGDRMLEDAE
jgi:hypothetical protein